MLLDYDVLSIMSMVFLGLIAIGYFNEKVLKLPVEIGLMTTAFLISVVILLLEMLGVTSITSLDKALNGLDLHEIIMNGFICFLLFSGSAKIKFHDLTYDKYLISSLAFFSTFLATLIYAGLSFYISKLVGIEMTFIESCILGSIVAPTDPISAMSILKKAGLPERISLVMEGESLFNDGIAVALFATFTTLNSTVGVDPTVSFFQTITNGIFGAVIVGLGVSFLLFQIFKTTKQKHVEILVSLAAVTTSYVLSEHFGVSGPTAAVVVGIFFATNMHKLHADNETYYSNFYVFWKVIDKILNGILYVLIGFSVLFLHQMSGFLIIFVSAIGLALLARVISIILPVYFFSRDASINLENYKGERQRKDQVAMAKLLTWGGLKGGICIALALGTAHQFTPVQYNYIVTSTYAVVAFSTLVQGLTIQKLYARVKKDLC
ncbi:cation:proton antiporter [Fusibacter sp. JL216-2]|uniref:cation:proton antiporter n=1 Tax=Fusibacter sp. JL216-2 TaxID=3071453 RepID=UPI003D3391FE